MFIIALYIKNPPIMRIINNNAACRRAASIVLAFEYIFAFVYAHF